LPNNGLLIKKNIYIFYFILEKILMEKETTKKTNIFENDQALTNVHKQFSRNPIESENATFKCQFCGHCLSEAIIQQIQSYIINY